MTNTSQFVVDEAFEQTELPPEKAGTAVDRRDMYRMGKTQEFKVRLFAWSSSSFGACSAPRQFSN